MKRKRPLIDGWVCPQCGAVGHRHGRGGQRACRDKTAGPTCEGLVCRCRDGKCFSKAKGPGWRRSPCPNAYCHHCGYEGPVRSKEFERSFGDSRCPYGTTGWHRALLRVEENERPGACRILFRCEDCGATGSMIIHPVTDIDWRSATPTEVSPPHDPPTKR